MKKNKILLISPDYPPPFIGGSLVYMHTLIEESLLNMSIMTDLGNRDNTEKVNYLESRYITNSSNPSTLSLMIMYFFILLKIPKILNYKIVILNISSAGNGFYAYILKKLGFKVVIISYAEELSISLKRKGNKGAIKRLLMRGYSHADMIISVSNFAKNILTSEMGIKKPINVIPTPLHKSKKNTDDYTYSKKLDKNFRIISVGRLIKRKGFIYLLKTIRKIVKENDNIKLTIIGDGPEYKAIINYISSNSLEKYVDIFRNVSDEFLVNAYKSNDIFILANIMLDNGDCEGAPNVLIEAASYGLPAIAGIEGGTSDVVNDNTTGFLIDPRDTDTMCNKILELMKNASKLDIMSKNSIYKAKFQHSKELAGKKFSEYIKML
ncbi:glycosyltransferase family 4 protein [Pelagibacterales bacterium]|nr:glycosyltransferase family 4 protein [Pelagibacterales bacterium]